MFEQKVLYCRGQKAGWDLETSTLHSFTVDGHITIELVSSPLLIPTSSGAYITQY